MTALNVKRKILSFPIACDQQATLSRLRYWHIMLYKVTLSLGINDNLHDCSTTLEW